VIQKNNTAYRSIYKPLNKTTSISLLSKERADVIVSGIFTSRELNLKDYLFYMNYYHYYYQSD
jgi:hypothetical protein